MVIFISFAFIFFYYYCYSWFLPSVGSFFPCFLYKYIFSFFLTFFFCFFFTLVQKWPTVQFCPLEQICIREKLTLRKNFSSCNLVPSCNFVFMQFRPVFLCIISKSSMFLRFRSQTYFQNPSLIFIYKSLLKHFSWLAYWYLNWVEHKPT